MNDHELTNLRKAAAAHMPHYTDAVTWSEALDHMAQKRRQPGQSFEQSYSAMLAADADANAMVSCLREAAGREMVGIAKVRSSAGRPTQRSQAEIFRSAAEAELAKMATARAQADAVSFEQAYCRVLDDPEGRELLEVVRA